MDVKKRGCILIALIMILSFSLSVSADNTNILSFGRILAAMPYVSAEIKGTGYDLSDISAFLGTEKLDIKDAHVYDRQKDSVRVYMLVDLSTSVKNSFGLMKNCMLEYVDNLGPRDSVVLITFGETEVRTVLDGDETPEEIKETINSLQCNEGGTLFYEALSQAYQMSNATISNFDREYVLAFSDGIDYQKGSTTYNELLNMYGSHNLPVYAACADNSSQKGADCFGELARTSGGNISIISDINIFNDLINAINDVTIIEMTASDNFADGSIRQLSIKIGESQVEQNIPISRSIEDNFAPEITTIYYDLTNDVIIISFSEKVNGNMENEAYKITNSNGDNIAVSSVTPSQKENTVEIKTAEALCDGTYTVSFNGITDISQQANPLTGEKTFIVSGAEVPVIQDEAETDALPVWAVLLIVIGLVLFIALIVIMVVVLSRKKDDEVINEIPAAVESKKEPEHIWEEENEYISENRDRVKHHIKMPDSVKIRIKIKTGNISEQQIETVITNSLIVGRSNICDIYIDDKKLSRQHFAIENKNGQLFISDLDSMNGTMLNGKRLYSSQIIHNNDKITAGLSDIIITILER